MQGWTPQKDIKLWMCVCVYIWGKVELYDLFDKFTKIDYNWKLIIKYQFHKGKIYITKSILFLLQCIYFKYLKSITFFFKVKSSTTTIFFYFIRSIFVIWTYSYMMIKIVTGRSWFYIWVFIFFYFSEVEKEREEKSRICESDVAIVPMESG